MPAGRPARAPEPAGPVRRVAVPLGVLAAVAGAFAYVGAVDPNRPGHYPLCPLLYLTGLYCPGCGGLRGAYALAHGRFGTALRCNALAMAGYVMFVALWALWFTRAARGRDTTPPAPRRSLRWALWGLIAVFTVVRNLPIGSVLAP
nr:DUF2752 domain-containing protein [Streptomyces sp. HPF1205]